MFVHRAFMPTSFHVVKSDLTIQPRLASAAALSRAGIQRACYLTDRLVFALSQISPQARRPPATRKVLIGSVSPLIVDYRKLSIVHERLFSSRNIIQFTHTSAKPHAGNQPPICISLHDSPRLLVVQVQEHWSTPHSAFALL